MEEIAISVVGVKNGIAGRANQFTFTTCAAFIKMLRGAGISAVRAGNHGEGFKRLNSRLHTFLQVLLLQKVHRLQSGRNERRNQCNAFFVLGLVVVEGAKTVKVDHLGAVVEVAVVGDDLEAGFRVIQHTAPGFFQAGHPCGLVVFVGHHEAPGSGGLDEVAGHG